MKKVLLASFLVFYCLMATTAQSQEKVIHESRTGEASGGDTNAGSREELIRESRRRSRRRAKRLNRLSSLVSLWLKTVAVDMTVDQRKKLWKLPLEALRKLEDIGVLREHPSVSEEEREGLGPFQRAVLAYINEARDENPILQQVEADRDRTELRDAYRSYVQTERDATEEKAHKRVREVLMDRVGEVTRAQSARRRATFLIRRALSDIYRADPERKKWSKSRRRGLLLISEAMGKLKDAGFFAGPDAFSREVVQTDDDFTEAVARHLSVAKENNNPLLDVEKVPPIQTPQMARKSMKQRPEQEKQAGQVGCSRT